MPPVTAWSLSKIFQPLWWQRQRSGNRDAPKCDRQERRSTSSCPACGCEGAKRGNAAARDDALFARPMPRLARPSDRRDGERLMTLYRVGSLSIDDRRELCLIKNISAGGMMVRAYCVIPQGTRLTVEFKCGQPISRRRQLDARCPCRDQLRRAHRCARPADDLDGRPAPAHAADRSRSLCDVARRRVDLSHAGVRREPGRTEDPLRNAACCRAATSSSRLPGSTPSRASCAGSTAIRWD